MPLLKKTLCLFALVLLCATGAKAATVSDLIDALSVKSSSKKIEAIQQLGASGAPQAEPVLTALLAGHLYVLKSADKTVIATKFNGVYSLTDPLNAAPAGEVEKSALSKIKINNKIRKVIKATIGQLDLTHENSARRMKAAKSLFLGLDKTMLAPLEQQAAKEQDEAIKGAFEKAIAAITLSHGSDLTNRLQAVDVLMEYSGPDVQSLFLKLDRTLAQNKDDASIQLSVALQKSIETIELRLETYGYVESLFQGISLGSILLLAAIGLAITFGVMGVINMAHGEMVMIGAYTTYVIQEVCRTTFPGLFDYSLVVAVPAAFLVAGAFGVMIERSVIQFLYGRPLETLLATWGVSLVLQQLVRSIFGPTNQEVGAPSWLSGAWEITGGLSFTYNRIAIILFALAVLFLLMLVLKKTAFGLQMRAVTQNRQMAGSMGIRSARVDAMTFGLGSGVAGMAGVALSQIDNVSPNLGQAYIIDSFMVVVFGGVGNLWGTLVGAGSLGIVNKFLEPYSGAVLAKILVLVAIILFIQKRPRGLFALKGRSVEG